MLTYTSLVLPSCCPYGRHTCGYGKVGLALPYATICDSRAYHIVIICHTYGYHGLCIANPLPLCYPYANPMLTLCYPYGRHTCGYGKVGIALAYATIRDSRVYHIVIICHTYSYHGLCIASPLPLCCPYGNPILASCCLYGRHICGYSKVGLGLP